RRGRKAKRRTDGSVIASGAGERVEHQRQEAVHRLRGRPVPSRSPIRPTAASVRSVDSKDFLTAVTLVQQTTRAPSRLKPPRASFASLRTRSCTETPTAFQESNNDAAFGPSAPPRENPSEWALCYLGPSGVRPWQKCKARWFRTMRYRPGSVRRP